MHEGHSLQAAGMRRMAQAFNLVAKAAVWAHRSAFTTFDTGRCRPMSAQQPPAETELRRPSTHAQPIATDLMPASFGNLPWRIADVGTIGAADA